MLKIFLAVSLLIMTVLPKSNIKSDLEQKIRATINSTPFETHNEAPQKNYKTVELTNDFRDRSASSEAAYFVDAGTGQVLLSKNADRRMQIASITKLMTALLIVEEGNFDKTVTVGNLNTRSDDAVMGLANGDRISVDGLLNGLLIASGSDAAMALAIQHSGDVDEFVKKMNEHAKIIGLTETNFQNAVGWDNPNNYSTAHDLAILSKVALSSTKIKSIVSKKSERVRSENGRSYILLNTNKLLGENNVTGAKTGTTYQAGECLVVSYEDDQKKIIGVTLNSPSRFSESRSIIKWINSSYTF